VSYDHRPYCVMLCAPSLLGWVGLLALWKPWGESLTDSLGGALIAITLLPGLALAAIGMFMVLVGSRGLPAKARKRTAAFIVSYPAAASVTAVVLMALSY
jgi:hypothetical protein